MAGEDGPQGTTQLMLTMKLVFDDRLAGFRHPACWLWSGQVCCGRHSATVDTV